MRFSEAMSRVMDEKGLTQKDVVVATGLSKQYVSLIKNGKTENPTFDRAAMIIRALGCDVEEFVNMLDRFE